MKVKDTVIKVSTSMLIPNKKKQEIYQTPSNYEEIKNNIEEHGIIEPLLVNRKTNIIISGNLRLQIALELGIQEVPVIYKDLEENEMDVKSISTNQQRQKSTLDILKEIEFFEEHYKIKKGQRTDLNPDLKKIKDERDSHLKAYSRTRREKIKAVSLLLADLYGRESLEFEGALNSVDKGKTTLNGLYQHLIDKTMRTHNAQVIPEKYEILKENTQIYNHSSLDMHELESGSIQSIITSPPYYKMKDYGNGDEELGQEQETELYLVNLMEIFKECYRVLRDDGSLFVNINDCVLGGQYKAVPHYFVVKMMELGWLFNDELLWIKNNPTYTRGKRSVRSHEPIFHFVKSPDFFYDDSWLKDLSDKEDKISYGINKTSPKVKSGLDFRKGVLTTNVANTSELRKECKEEGFYLTHSATFPIDVPAICGLLSTKEGDTILDCFAGTSTVGLFARSNNRKFVGYDMNPEFIKASEVRIGGLLFMPPSRWEQEILKASITSPLENVRAIAYEAIKNSMETIPPELKKSFRDFTKVYDECFRSVQQMR